MKTRTLSLIAAALVAVTTQALAKDVTVQSKDKYMKIVIHSAGMDAQYNKRTSDIQVNRV